MGTGTHAYDGHPDTNADAIAITFTLEQWEAIADSALAGVEVVRSVQVGETVQRFREVVERYANSSQDT